MSRINPTPVNKAQEAYLEGCKRNNIRPNSGFFTALSQPGANDAMVRFDETGESIISVNLRDNYCGPEYGFEALLDAVSAGMPKLEHLDLSGNYLTSDNVTDLVAVLLKHESICSLTLHNNRLFIDAGQQLVRLARFNPRMIRMDVVDAADPTEDPTANRIPPRFLDRIGAALMHNAEQLQRQADDEADEDDRRSADEENSRDRRDE